MAKTSDAPSDATKPKDAVEISADCKTMTAKGEPIKLTLIDTKAGQYLQVYNDNGERDCIDREKQHCGTLLLRYSRDGDIIHLYAPDHPKVANAIAKGSIKGFSERAESNNQKSNEPIFRNVIEGTAEQIDDVLRKNSDIFSAEPIMVLKHVSKPAPLADAPAPVGSAAPAHTVPSTQVH